MKNYKLRFLMPFLFLPMLFWSCTDLEEVPFGVITPDDFFQTDDEILASVMPVYNSLGKARWSDGIPHLQDVAADAIVVPTRGGDWDDGGKWRELHQHTWTSVNNPVNMGWVDAYTGIARANATIEALSKSPKSETAFVATLIGEVRVLRALFYWWLIDLYGDVPLVTDPATDPENPPSQSPRADVFDFVVTEIKDVLALNVLKEKSAAATYGQVTEGAANALLATVYLNAEVYTGTAKWAECVAACDAVINSGDYALMSTVTDVFALENEGTANTEYILVVVSLNQGGAGFVRHSATLHYSQLPSSPWNGFSVVADYYNTYDTADARIDQLLVGQQYILGGPTKGDSAFQRDLKPLVYSVESPIFGATESHGVRILKWPIDPNMVGGDAGNDYAVFRYSHILLAKAEAEFKLSGGGLASLNLVHERAGLDALGAITAEAIYNERGYELLWEGFRRQDQIRMGTYLGEWANKDASAEYRKIFPIPQTQMDANPNLVQNTGY